MGDMLRHNGFCVGFLPEIVPRARSKIYERDTGKHRLLSVAWE